MSEPLDRRQDNGARLAEGQPTRTAGTQNDDGFQPPIALTPLNTQYNEYRPNLRPDGLEIVFDPDRPGSKGATDIYTSTRASLHTPWDQAWHITTGPVNTPAGESRASLSWDGTTLYYGRAGDIYTANRTKLNSSG